MESPTECGWIFEAAFDSLDLSSSGDATGEAIARAMKPLKTWAGNSQQRLSTVYDAGLRVAANSVGGPLGAALLGVGNYSLLQESRHNDHVRLSAILANPNLPCSKFESDHPKKRNFTFSLKQLFNCSMEAFQK